MELQAKESLVILSYTKRIRKNEEKRLQFIMKKWRIGDCRSQIFVWNRRKQGSAHRKTGPFGSHSKQQYTTLRRMPSLLQILHWPFFPLRAGKCLSQKRADGGASSEG